MAASQLLGRSISKKGKTNVVRPEVTPKGSPFDVDKLALPATRKISKDPSKSDDGFERGPSSLRASFISRIIHFAETPESGYGSEPSEEEEERIEEEYAILGKGREKRLGIPSNVMKPLRVMTWRSLIRDLLLHLKPFPTREEFQTQSIFTKIITVLKIIPVFLFKLTIPLNESCWSKGLAVIHCFICLQFGLFAFGRTNTKFFASSPGIWAYALGVSAILALLIIFFTRTEDEPRHFKSISSYAGFVMSVCWIYAISSEVVDVVTMIGVVSGISFEILGLSVLAWSNSIGDMIVDPALARRGFSRMAMAAAIGGPLFNLLIGFGLPFTIAKAQGKEIALSFKPTYKLLILFLSISLSTTLIAMLVQRFRLRRVHGVILVLIYIVFLVFVLLDATRVLVWN